MHYNFRTDFYELFLNIPSIISCLIDRGFISKGIIIGYDGAKDSCVIYNMLKDLLQKYDVVEAAICSTPALAYLCKSNNVVGLMVTASHCARKYSGLKIIKSSGYTISSEIEQDVMNYICAKPNRKRLYSAIECKEHLTDNIQCHESYFNILHNKIHMLGEKLSICVYKDSEPFYRHLASEYCKLYISKEPDPERRENLVASKGYLISIDADGDKCIIYKDGERLNENGVIFTLSMATKCKKVISNKEISPETMNELSVNGVNVQLVQVGDQFISEVIESQPLKNVFGAESNGHYILPGYTYSDGLMAGISFVAGVQYQIHVNHPFSKAVIQYDTAEARNIDFKKISDRGKIQFDSMNEGMLYVNGSKMFVRSSEWEDSIILITFGKNSKNVLDFALRFIIGKVTRRIDYVEDKKYG